MRIYSMTATFGKLENQTLTLNPGLNVIPAPNEWGKSTWCAFLICMLYGIATKERTTPSVLADKDHYAPWSGKPMSGRIDLHWSGRDITIERSTKGRIPFGEFKAYETASGVPVPELTAANCGQMLLGAEKSVFTKSAFIRMTDMPVSDSEALRRRLNALVTSGDESSTGDELAQKLKELRNRCRHNRTGQIPQAEAQRDAIEEKLRQLHSLKEQDRHLLERIAQLDQQIRLLKNHKTTLAHTESTESAGHLAAALAAQVEAEQRYAAQQQLCSTLPTKEEAEEQILHLGQLQMEQEALHAEALPTPPEKPEIPAAFVPVVPEQAVAQAQEDFAAYCALSKSHTTLLWTLAGICLLGAVAVTLWNWLAALPFWAAAAAFLVIALCKQSKQGRRRIAITARYPGLPPSDWVCTAKRYADAMAQYDQRQAMYTALVNSFHLRKLQLGQTIELATGGCSLGACLDGWRETVSEHIKLDALWQAADQAQKHAKAMAAMVREATPPEFPDPLDYSEAETLQRLDRATAEHLHLEKQHSSCLAQMEVIGQQESLEKQYAVLEERIRQLQDIYDAMTLALETLAETASELQRRFAPKISSRAQALFSALTQGQYQRLILAEDLRLEAATEDENTLRSALWRSDGTADQLYFSLRLAVSEELIPACPLILDDALLRFDDTRLRAAMELLKASSKTRQIILFTCHGREAECL